MTWAQSFRIHHGLIPPKPLTFFEHKFVILFTQYSSDLMSIDCKKVLPHILPMLKELSKNLWVKTPCNQFAILDKFLNHNSIKYHEFLMDAIVLVTSNACYQQA